MTTRVVVGTPGITTVISIAEQGVPGATGIQGIQGIQGEIGPTGLTAKVEIARAYNTIRFQNIYMAQLISGEL